MLRICLPFFLCTIFFFGSNAQVTVVLNAANDNTIYQEATGNSNGIGQNFFSGNNAQSKPRRALLKFDLITEIPAGAAITSVTLTLFCNKATPGAYDIKIHRLLADWGEGKSDAASNEGGGISAAPNDATWVSRFHLLNLWNSPGGDFTASATASKVVGVESASYSWTSSQAVADVQNWLDNPTTNFGWIFIGNETTAQTARRFASRENPTPDQRPQLSVTYTAPTAPLVYTFTGTGNWEDKDNWSNKIMPPANLPADDEIIIDPPLTGECILNIAQTISAGGKLTVQANKKFRITGNLIIR